MEGQDELARAQEARAAGEDDVAVVHLARAARWRLPVVGTHDEAIEELTALADDYVSREPPERTEALACLREVRRALLATRHLWTPDAAQLELVNVRISELMAAQEAALGMDTGGEEAAATWHLERLREAPAPRRPWVAALASLGFLGWVVSVGGFIARGLDARGRVRGRAAVRWGLAFLISLGTWMVAISLAR